MRRIICFVAALLPTLFTPFWPGNAFAAGVVYCGTRDGLPACVAALRYPNQFPATQKAQELCRDRGIIDCRIEVAYFLGGCRSALLYPAPNSRLWSQGRTNYEATQLTAETCKRSPSVPTNGCAPIFTVCETSDNLADIASDPGPAFFMADYTGVTTLTSPPPASSEPVARADSAPTQQIIDKHAFDFLNDPNFYRMLIITKLLEDVWTGITIGIGILLVIVIFAKRAPILNYVIHGNLPYKLPVYGEDMQCLFKRTQRENWYGRVVFGIVVNLAMTHQQLNDVRKYWLGRVVAFDSLRRQRQNQLAKMHMQLAASAKSDAHDKKKFWSRRWATVRTFIRRLFWIFAAVFRLIFAFLFIRVNIAKLVRGTIIESKDLTLVLQAKEAIEESAAYLKEYLETANTFDGRDEIV